MRKYLLFGLLLLGDITVYCQHGNFDFYGNTVNTIFLTPADNDTLLKGKVPQQLAAYIKSSIQQFGLEDWSVVLFLKKFVSAQFINESHSVRVKILSSLLTSQNINNAIGVRNRHRLLPLVIINRRLVLYNINVFDEQGYKLIWVDPAREPFKIRDIDVSFFKGNDILFKASPPRFNVTDYRSCIRTFTNYITKTTDTIVFNYSPKYMEYSYDFPMALSHVSYEKSPVSPVFTATLFEAINKKISQCRTKPDSINFLLFFAKTAIKYELNNVTYSPESALAGGKGDCDDRTALLAFLLNYYFKDLDIVFLNYDTLEHVRLGIYDEAFDTNNKSFVEYKGKKYLLAETTDDFTLLGDSFYVSTRRPSQIVE